MRFPPGPRNWIPGANLRGMARRPATFLEAAARRYGDAVHFKVGPRHVFFFNHPDLIRDVLVTRQASFHKGLVLQRAKVVFGEGLLTSEGDLHKRQRRLAAPAFHRERIHRYAEVMIDRAARTREEWRDGEELDVTQAMMRLTLSVVAKTLFDANVDDEADEIRGALSEMVEMFPLLIHPFSDIIRRLPLPQVRRFERALERLDRTIYAIIAERRRSGEDRGDLLSMLLLAQDVEGDGGEMSDRQVRDEAMTLFLAGHETTANALAWTFYLLARNPDAERAFHHELDTVLAGRLPTPADYPRLVMTERILAESMRVFPPAWGVGRYSIEDAQVGEWTVPAKSMVVLSPFATHRDPRWWLDPTRFDPARFTPDAKAARPKFAYFPFGGGPRVCIGETFAWMEGALILATIGQRWRLLRGPDVEAQPYITLRAKGAMRMRAEGRT